MCLKEEKENNALWLKLMRNYYKTSNGIIRQKIYKLVKKTIQEFIFPKSLNNWSSWN